MPRLRDRILLDDPRWQEDAITLIRVEQTSSIHRTRWRAWDEHGTEYFLNYRGGWGYIETTAREGSEFMYREFDWTDPRERSINHISLAAFCAKTGVHLADSVSPGRRPASLPDPWEY